MRIPDLTSVRHTAVAVRERLRRMCNGVLSARNPVIQVVVSVVDMMSVMERAPVVVMMPRVAVMPVPVIRPAAMHVPPTRIISPIPRTMPCVPTRTPEPVVDNRSIDVYRFDDVVRTIYILIAYHLHTDFVGRFVFLHIYGGYVLEDIFRQNRLQHDQTLVTFTGLDNTKIVHLSVAVQIQVTERAIRVVEHRLELFQVLSLCEQFSYNLQIESFRDVRTVGRYRDGFLCPKRCTHHHQRHQKCS